MIKKFNEFINEDFTDLYKRWKNKEVRKENKIDYQMVDLGLPSGTLWCDRNIGAHTPYETGEYYAWGETEPKKEYSLDTYTVDIDNVVSIGKDNDVAIKETKNKFHIPTKEQFEELIKHTTFKWTNNYNGSGVSGAILTSTINKNSLFFPGSGYYVKTHLFDENKCSCLWTKTSRKNDSVWHFYFNTNYCCCSYYKRYFGYNIRGVVG